MARTETRRKSKSVGLPPDIPDKLYFRIGEVARLLALPTYVLRFWETEFPHLKPNKGGTGQRLYRRRDVEALLEIKALLYDAGYTIAGARQFLREKVHPAERLPALQTEPGNSQLPDAITASLSQLKSDLREIACLLARPVERAAVKHAAHRGLHLAARRRNASQGPPPLFAAHEDKPDDGQEDGSGDE